MFPKKVRYSRRLKAIEKLLYFEIAEIIKEKGVCDETNAYFAELFDTTKQTISNYIQSLKKEELINIEFGGNGTKRYIYLNQ